MNLTLFGFDEGAGHMCALHLENHLQIKVELVLIDTYIHMVSCGHARVRVGTLPGNWSLCTRRRASSGGRPAWCVSEARRPGTRRPAARCPSPAPCRRLATPSPGSPCGASPSASRRRAELQPKRPRDHPWQRQFRCHRSVSFHSIPKQFLAPACVRTYPWPRRR